MVSGKKFLGLHLWSFTGAQESSRDFREEFRNVSSELQWPLECFKSVSEGLKSVSMWVSVEGVLGGFRGLPGVLKKRFRKLHNVHTFRSEFQGISWCFKKFQNEFRGFHRLSAGLQEASRRDFNCGSRRFQKELRRVSRRFREISRGCIGFQMGFRKLFGGGL